LAGVAGTVAFARIIESHIHGVRPFDAATIASASLFLLACALCATWWPARRASNADVVTLLKAE
jgi:ABC-type lipoprotein release transport system permease subunit